MYASLEGEQIPERDPIVAMALNPEMVATQGIDRDGVEAVARKHLEMESAKAAVVFAIGNGREAIDRAVALVEQLDFELQDLWKFKRDAKFHAHWYATPLCRCPTALNLALMGYPLRVVSRSCPLHVELDRADGIKAVFEVAPPRLGATIPA